MGPALRGCVLRQLPPPPVSAVWLPVLPRASADPSLLDALSRAAWCWFSPDAAHTHSSGPPSSACPSRALPLHLTTRPTLTRVFSRPVPPGQACGSWGLFCEAPPHPHLIT